MHALETKTFSPKELAQVVGVSESSIKRWVDAGHIEVTRTAGGHRRILWTDALRFIRAQDMHVLHPEMLGLPDLEFLPSKARRGDLTGEVLFELFKTNEAAKARGLIAAAFLDGGDMAGLWDGPIAEALRLVGELWQEGEEGIFLEHRATALCIEALNQVRLLIPPPREEATRALGGAASGDPYLLPNLTAAAVLADLGYADVNLGPETPPEVFLHAADEVQPALFWLAHTASRTKAEREALVRNLLLPLHERGIDVVVGGHTAEANGWTWPDEIRLCRSMTELAAFAKERLGGSGLNGN